MLNKSQDDVPLAMKIVTVCLFLSVFAQMWRHDRGREWPVDGGHEPFRTGAHVEGAEKQGHSDGDLLAWQPGVDFETGFESNIFLF